MKAALAQCAACARRRRFLVPRLQSTSTQHRSIATGWKRVAHFDGLLGLSHDEEARAAEEAAVHDNRPRLVFQGAGLLLAFHIGVAAYAQHHFHLDGDAAAFSGASGGAVVAALTAVGIPASRAQGLNLAMVSRAKQRRFGPLYHGLSDLEQLLLQEMPSDEAVRRATRGRRLCISLTSLPLLQNTLLERHESRADLARAVVCSMNLPLFLCPAQPLNGRLYIDGGISNNTPRGELRNAVTVSPRTGGGDICPRRNFDARHFFVPGDAGFMRALEEAGWQAAADAHDLLCAKGFRENGARVEAPPQHDDVQLPVSWASA